MRLIGPPKDLSLRIDEIMELGERLRREAERNGIGVNASHMMVHQVMVRAFSDEPDDIHHSELQAALMTQLRHKLQNREIGHRVSL